MRTVDPIQYAERRQTILTAARRCFARAGFRGATMQQICREAGMSAGHLYHYFVGKDAIIEALVAQDEALANDALLRIEVDADPVQALTAELMQACNYDAETKSLAFDMVTEAQRNITVGALVDASYRNIVGRIAQFLTAAKAAGTIASHIDPQATAIALCALGKGLMDPKLPHGSVSREQLELAIRAAVNGLLRPR